LERNAIDLFSIISFIYCFHRQVGDDLLPPDVYYKLLTKSTQILREQYIHKMLLAKAELENR